MDALNVLAPFVGMQLLVAGPGQGEVQRLSPAAAVQRHQKVGTKVAIVDVNALASENTGVHFHGPLLSCLVHNA